MTPRSAALSILLLAAVTAAGCTHARNSPEALVDGSAPERAPVVLEGVASPTVLTRAHLLDSKDNAPSDLRAAVSACMRARSARPIGAAVVRIGVVGTSVTYRTGPSELAACDDSTGAREANRRWCGFAAGSTRSGRLNDPRLQIGCRTRTGAPVGFAWIDPVSAARYVVITQDGYVEIYRVLGRVPVRVATARSVDVERTTVTLGVAEHDRAGGRIRSYELVLSVAG